MTFVQTAAVPGRILASKRVQRKPVEFSFQNYGSPFPPSSARFQLSPSKVELDHRYNPGDDSVDLVYDHVGVHSAGRGSNNSALASSALAPPVVWDLADGKSHLVKAGLN